MKQPAIIIASIFFATTLMAGTKDSLVNYALPDSVQANGFIASIQVTQLSGDKDAMAGIKTSQVVLSLQADKKERNIVLLFPSGATIITSGIDVKTSKEGKLAWSYNWQVNEKYKLFITTAADSAENFILYSGYIYFPSINKWKLIGTAKLKGYTNTVKSPQSFFTTGKKNTAIPGFSELWCQRDNGSWRNLQADASPVPVILPVFNIDSVRQAGIDQQIIEKSGANTTPSLSRTSDGLYYTRLREGTGRQVSINDTVTILYKGSLYSDGSVFDETKNEPRTFPLNRLIRGWQLGVPLSKVGGKIKLVIPSGIAYTVRTRAAKIPPNSILVFEIEVLNAKIP
jgi:FKBP-type peptidyl-prolyl cis-trans isomerase FkpA